MANTFRNDIYRPAKTLAYIVIALFALLALCSALYIVLSLFMLAAPDARMNLDGGESMHIGFGLIGLVSILEILLRIPIVVLFLIWEHRSFNNLSALRARNLEFSPGWAVGWWFIPFANLVKPFQAIRELWNESDPDFDTETGFLHTSAGTPALIAFWWAFFLLSGVAGNVSNAMIDSKTGQVSEMLPPALIFASLLQLGAAVTIILIVKGITERQDKRFAKLGASQQFQPPPPNFYQNG